MTTPTNQRDSEGRPHGVWEGYWPNGTLWRRRHYMHGKPHGLWETYHENGAPSWKEYYIRIK